MASRRSEEHEANEAVAALLDEADDAFERDEPLRALELSEAALEKAPRSPEALHYRAAALSALDRLDEAEQAYREALRAAPDDLAILKGAAELLVLDLQEDRDAVEEGFELARRSAKLARRRKETGYQVDFMLLGAIALSALGEAHRALELLNEARPLAPDDAELALERAIAYFDLCRLGEAKRELERVLTLSPDDPWAHHYLGLIAERQGDPAARRHFAESRKKNPKDFPTPVQLSAEAFDRTIKDALERLPERVRSYLDNVSIVVQDLPRDDDLLANDPPLSPSILGLFHGTPITEKSHSDPWSNFPSSIALYQKNLERIARTREDLIEQIGITLIHEVGHFLGLTEEDLYDRGLD